MRYTDTVILKYQNDKTPKRYDPALGRMVGGEEWRKEVKCNVTGASLDLQARLGGLLNDTSLVVRFRSPVTVSVTSVEYQGSKYIPVTTRGYLAGRSVLYVNKAVK
jgi:gp104|nr:MAG TPA: head closure knob [Caudoviricetes sp.]